DVPRLTNTSHNPRYASLAQDLRYPSSTPGAVAAIDANAAAPLPLVADLDKLDSRLTA
ncbi:hypothetical protein LTR48_003445, partial [Friedmanniomyces endolithicus]